MVEKVVDCFFGVRFFEGELSEGKDGKFCHIFLSLTKYTIIKVGVLGFWGCVVSSTSKNKSGWLSAGTGCGCPVYARSDAQLHVGAGAGGCQRVLGSSTA